MKKIALITFMSFLLIACTGPKLDNRVQTAFDYAKASDKATTSVGHTSDTNMGKLTEVLAVEYLYIDSKNEPLKNSVAFDYPWYSQRLERKSSKISFETILPTLIHETYKLKNPEIIDYVVRIQFKTDLMNYIYSTVYFSGEEVLLVDYLYSTVSGRDDYTFKNPRLVFPNESKETSISEKELKSFNDNLN